MAISQFLALCCTALTVHSPLSAGGQGVDFYRSINPLVSISAKFHPPAGTQSHSHNKWTWPVTNPDVARGFSPPAKPWLAGHRGIDLKGIAIQEVTSAGDGIVIFAGELAGRGVVSIQHGKLRTTYEPVKPEVHAGDVVATGQKIGVLTPGTSHCSERGEVRCLHWGLRKGFNYLNPLVLLKGHIRLFPD